jgi:nitrogen regulatory protein PII
MKRIKAIIRPSTLDEVKEALRHHGNDEVVRIRTCEHGNDAI